MKPPLPHLESSLVQYDEAPDQPGLYWLYGDPHMGEMGGHYTGSVKPEYGLHLVRVVKVSNGVIGYTGTTIVSLTKWNGKNRGWVGVWYQVIIPDLVLDHYS